MLPTLLLARFIGSTHDRCYVELSVRSSEFGVLVLYVIYGSAVWLYVVVLSINCASVINIENVLGRDYANISGKNMCLISIPGYLRT